jgi:hypothetical protein
VPATGFVRVGLDLTEAEVSVELVRRAHLGRRVEPDPVVAEVACRSDRVDREASSEPAASIQAPDIEPLQLRRALVEFAHGDTAGGLPVDGGEQDQAAWRRVLPGQPGELGLVALEAEVEAERGCVFAEERLDEAGQRVANDPHGHVRIVRNGHWRAEWKRGEIPLPMEHIRNTLVTLASHLFRYVVDIDNGGDGCSKS